MGAARAAGTPIHVSRDFERYVAVRRAYGAHHLNQAFDPCHVRFDARDFWLLAEDRDGAPLATYCSRTFEIGDFYSLVISQTLWFGAGLRLVDPRFEVRRTLPAFGGTVAHAGGFWIRPEHRGHLALTRLMPRLARALALRNAAIEHDSGMLLDDPSEPVRERLEARAAAAVRTYGFARAGVMVDGWFPPEHRVARVRLCHSNRAEAISSLLDRVNLRKAA